MATSTAPIVVSALSPGQRVPPTLTQIVKYDGSVVLETLEFLNPPPLRQIQFEDDQSGGCGPGKFLLYKPWESTTNLQSGNWLYSAIGGGFTTSALSVGNTTVPVDDGSDFLTPSTPQSIGSTWGQNAQAAIICDGVNSEIIMVTSKNGNSLTTTSLTNAYAKGATVAILRYAGIIVGREREIAYTAQFTLLTMGFGARLADKLIDYQITNHECNDAIVKLLLNYSSYFPDLSFPGSLPSTGVNFTGTGNGERLSDVVQKILDTANGGATATTTLSVAATAGATSFQPASMSGIGVGSSVTIDTGANIETLFVESTTSTTFTSTRPAQYAHSMGATISAALKSKWVLFVDARRTIQVVTLPTAPTVTLSLTAGSPSDPLLTTVVGDLKVRDQDITTLANTLRIEGGKKADGTQCRIIVQDSSSQGFYRVKESVVSQDQLTDETAAATWGENALQNMGWPTLSGSATFATADLTISARNSIQITGFDDGSTFTFQPPAVVTTCDASKGAFEQQLQVMQLQTDINAIVKEIVSQQVMRMQVGEPGTVGNFMIVDGCALSTSGTTVSITAGHVLVNAVQYAVPTYSAGWANNATTYYWANCASGSAVIATTTRRFPDKTLDGFTASQAVLIGYITVGNNSLLGSWQNPAQGLGSVHFQDAPNSSVFPGISSVSITLAPEGQTAAQAQVTVNLATSLGHPLWLGKYTASYAPTVAGGSPLGVNDHWLPPVPVVYSQFGTSFSYTLHNLAASQDWDLGAQIQSIFGTLYPTTGPALLTAAQPSISKSAIQVAITATGMPAMPGGATFTATGVTTTVYDAGMHTMLVGAGSGWNPILWVGFTLGDSNSPNSQSWGYGFVPYLRQHSTASATDKTTYSRMDPFKVAASSLGNGSAQNVLVGHVTPGQSVDVGLALIDQQGNETALVQLVSNYTVPTVNLPNCPFPNGYVNADGSWSGVDGASSTEMFSLSSGQTVTVVADIAKATAGSIADIVLGDKTNGYSIQYDSSGNVVVQKYVAGVASNITGFQAISNNTSYHSLRLTVTAGSPNQIEGSVDGVLYSATDSGLTLTSGTWPITLFTGGATGKVLHYHASATTDHYGKLPARAKPIIIPPWKSLPSDNSPIADGTVFGRHVYATGGTGSHNFIFNPTFTNGLSNWSTIAGSISVDTYGGGRAHVSQIANTITGMQQLVTGLVSGQTMTVQCVIEVGGATLPAGTNLYLRVTDDNGNYVTNATPIDSTYSPTRYLRYTSFAVPSSGKVFIQAFVSNGGSTNGADIMFSKFQLEYGNAATYWVDHNSNALVTQTHLPAPNADGSLFSSGQVTTRTMTAGAVTNNKVAGTSVSGTQVFPACYSTQQTNASGNATSWANAANGGSPIAAGSLLSNGQQIFYNTGSGAYGYPPAANARQTTYQCPANGSVTCILSHVAFASGGGGVVRVNFAGTTSGGTSNTQQSTPVSGSQSVNWWATGTPPPNTNVHYGQNNGTTQSFSVTTSQGPGASYPISLNLSSVTCPSDTDGASDLTITLTNPNGTVVLSQSGITAPGTWTYSPGTPDVSGQYVWKIQAIAHNSHVYQDSPYNSTYTVSFSGTASYWVTSGASGNTYVKALDGSTQRLSCNDGNVLFTQLAPDTIAFQVFNSSSSALNFSIGVDVTGV